MSEPLIKHRESFTFDFFADEDTTDALSVKTEFIQTDFGSPNIIAIHTLSYEMDSVKGELQLFNNDITPKKIRKWASQLEYCMKRAGLGPKFNKYYDYKYLEMSRHCGGRFHLYLGDKALIDGVAKLPSFQSANSSDMEDIIESAVNPTHFSLYAFMTDLELVQCARELRTLFPTLIAGRIVKYCCGTCDTDFQQYINEGNKILRDYCIKHNIEIYYDDPG